MSRGRQPSFCQGWVTCGWRFPSHSSSSSKAAPAHPAQALENRRQRCQMSWSNICTTFPAFTKKAFYTQSTLGDELGRQSRESPLKLTLQLWPDKGSASSSLMWTKEGNLFIIPGEKERKQKAQKRHYGLAMRDELFKEPQ